MGIRYKYLLRSQKILSTERRRHTLVPKNGSAQLDEWVLCRIYKKKSSSTQKVPMSSPSLTGQEHSYNSSSSSSSHLDDVLESLPKIEDRFFSLPRMKSLKTLQNGLGSSNFDWATLAGLNSEPELLNTGQQSQSNQTQGMMVNNNNNYSNDVYVPSIAGLKRRRWILERERGFSMVKGCMICICGVNMGLVNGGDCERAQSAKLPSV